MKKLYIRPKVDIDVVYIAAQMINASTDISISDKDADNDGNYDGNDNLSRSRYGSNGYSRNGNSNGFTEKRWGNLW